MRTDVSATKVSSRDSLFPYFLIVFLFFLHGDQLVPLKRRVQPFFSTDGYFGVLRLYGLFPAQVIMIFYCLHSQVFFTCMPCLSPHQHIFICIPMICDIELHSLRLHPSDVFRFIRIVCLYDMQKKKEST
jgi:hypothetical protein